MRRSTFWSATATCRSSTSRRGFERALAAALLAAIWFQAAQAQELVFFSAADAGRVLAARDAFVERMSPFDRAARLKTDREVAEGEYLEFAAAAALDWEDAEREKITDAFREIEPRLDLLRLPLPDKILLIKTTGQEEGNTGYTRGNAVILPASAIAKAADLPKLLAHELFHIASRGTPGFAEALYATIGFHPCGEAAFPPELSARKLTNPDAPRNDYCIALTLDGVQVLVTQILFSRSPVYDTAQGGEFFSYLQVGLLVVDSAGASGTTPPSARVVSFRDVTGFFEQVGQNTQYVIHPEEILADNFSLLAIGHSAVPSPEIHARIRQALAELR